MSLSTTSVGVDPTARAVDTRARSITPVKWWAAIGVIVVLFEVFVLTRWITGPLFERVPVGPTPVPTYMKVALTFFQIASIPAALLCIYLLVVRPWRRDGRLSVDGAFTIAFTTLWFQDPLSAYSGHWMVYNSWAINFGSWLNSIPFALGKAAPGAMLVEPILIMPGVFVWLFVFAMLTGCWVMRVAHRRWPHFGVVRLGLICIGVSWVMDFIFEGLVFMPLGVWEYPGGHLNIFADTYHQYPLHEMFFAGGFFGVVAMLNYFRNDRGETLADRGLESLKVSDRTKNILRAFATIGIVNVGMLVFYNIPNTWTATHSAEWPEDLVQRSYFTNGICGADTDQMCPGPAVPQYRNDNRNSDGGSAHLDPSGQVVVPPDTKLPALVPFELGK
jgi:hypothetical protein